MLKITKNIKSYGFIYKRNVYCSEDISFNRSAAFKYEEKNKNENKEIYSKITV